MSALSASLSATTNRSRRIVYTSALRTTPGPVRGPVCPSIRLAPVGQRRLGTALRRRSKVGRLARLERPIKTRAALQIDPPESEPPAGQSRVLRIFSAVSRFITNRIETRSDILPARIMSILIGFFFGGALRPFGKEVSVLAPAVIASLSIIAVGEIVSFVAYSNNYTWVRDRFPRAVELLNLWKIGMLFGLFCEAFKVGS